LHNLRVSLQFGGNFEGAKSACETEAALPPEVQRAYSPLLHLSRQTAEHHYIAALALQVEQGSDSHARLHIDHALGKTYDGLGDYAAAFAWLARGKAARLAQIGDPTAHYAKVFAAARAALANPPARAGFGTEEPIFVIGMPRSGTTLVDRILSAHGDV